MKRWMVLGALAVMMVGYQSPAAAACSVTGTLVRVEMNSGGRNTQHTIYLKQLKTDAFYYTARTNVYDLVSAATTLVALQSRVSITSDANACPSSGTSRDIGKLRTLVVNP